MSKAQPPELSVQGVNLEDQISLEDSDDDMNLNSGNDEEDDEEVPNGYTSADFSEYFSTKEIFKTRDDAMKWIRGVGRKHNTVVVIARSVKKSLGQNAKSWIECERHSKFREKRGRDLPTKVVKLRKSSSKRCGCPFRIKCYEVAPGAWVVKVTCGVHNHPVTKCKGGNRFDGRLTAKEYEITKELIAFHMKPKDILDELKKVDPLNTSTLRTVYNAKQRAKKEGLEGKTIVQQFMHQVDYNKYCERDRIFEDGVVGEMFFAHPKSFNLLRSFPYVLTLDATCKTNKLNMPFFEIVGYTSTWKNFPVAGVFIANEKTDSYEWILRQLKEMLRMAGKMPTVIVTDNELTLLNALTVEFPDTKHLLCHRHIYMDIEAKCSQENISKEEANKFEWRCKTVFQGKTEEEYNTMLALLEHEWSHQPSLVQHLHQMWLIPYKDKIVSAWTDNVTHFGIHTDTTSSFRVGSAHTRMKKFLGSNQGGLYTVFSHVHTQFELLIGELKASFEHSRTHVRDEVANLSCFRLLHGTVSQKALDLLMEEYKLLQKDEGLGVCECKLPGTHGLPCAHKIDIYVRERRPIELDMIHPMWKTLEFQEDAEMQEADEEDKEMLDVARRQHEDVTMEDFYARFPHMTAGDRMKAFNFMYGMLHPAPVTPVSDENHQGRAIADQEPS